MEYIKSVTGLNVLHLEMFHLGDYLRGQCKYSLTG